MDGIETAPASNVPCAVIAEGSGIEALQLLSLDFDPLNVPFTLYSDGEPDMETIAAQADPKLVALTARWHRPQTGQPIDLYEIMSTLFKDTLVYVYGPLAFIQTAIDAADCYGVLRTNLRFRRLDDGLTRTDVRAFDIVLERSARTVHIGKDVTMLDALLAAGVEVRRGCHDGHCGQCVVEVLEGEVEHRDVALNDLDRTLFGCMCSCVSRAKGASLVIDL